jgi:hypothetical protein
VLVVSFFTLAKRLLQRRREKNALLREEQHRLDAVDYHTHQDRLGGSQRGPHFERARIELSRLRRTCDEQRTLQTGKPHSQLYDIDKLALHMRALERDGSIELAYMWERIPTAAIPVVLKRMTELRRADERARDRTYLASTEGPGREGLTEFGQTSPGLRFQR